jgi:hypothetical protein
MSIPAIGNLSRQIIAGVIGLKEIYYILRLKSSIAPRTDTTYFQYSTITPAPDGIDMHTEQPGCFPGGQHTLLLFVNYHILCLLSQQEANWWESLPDLSPYHEIENNRHRSPPFTQALSWPAKEYDCQNGVYDYGRPEYRPDITVVFVEALKSPIFH